jgi:hypothetical protein
MSGFSVERNMRDPVVKGAVDAMVSEPYSLSLGELRKIIAYADAHNLDVSITARDASHFPGETLHIEWTRREELSC